MARFTGRTGRPGSIDYLKTREDLVAGKVGYYGVSWGGMLGGLLPAVEPGLQVAVLQVAGLSFNRVLPEADPLNFLPRIKIPVLMLNGRLDLFFPPETSQAPNFGCWGRRQSTSGESPTTPNTWFLAPRSSRKPWTGTTGTWVRCEPAAVRPRAPTEGGA